MTRKSETAIDRMLRHASDGLSASPAHAASKAAAIAALRHFLEWRKWEERAPAATELRAYLYDLLEIAGDPAAFNRFSYVMIAASHLWGRESTTVFAMVLRDARLRDKPARKSSWEVVRAHAEKLPDEWRARVVAMLPKEGDAARPLISWSPAYAKAVISALRQWIKHHEHEAVLPQLSGTGLHAFGEALDLEGKTHRTIRDYITRVSQAVADARGMTHRLRHELDWLLGLLTLRHVQDLDRPEADCFALIDPASPVVEEICLLTEALSSLCKEVGSRAA